MRNRIVPLIGLLFILIFPTGNCTADASKLIQKEKNTSASKLLDDLQRGEWLNKKYIDKLKATKSPRLAVNGIVEDSFSIKKKQGEYLLMVIYNFHEGGSYFKVTGLKQTTKKGVYNLIVQVPDYTSEKNNKFTLIKKNSSDEILWTYESDHQKIKNTFIRVEPSVSVFVNRILLVGEYIDNKGRKFLFTESGKAIWPDNKFRYEIILDYVDSPAPCDFLMEVDERGRYSNPAVLYQFLWKDKYLFIYTVNNRDNVSNCGKQPTYILSPAKSK